MNDEEKDPKPDSPVVGGRGPSEGPAEQRGWAAGDGARPAEVSSDFGYPSGAGWSDVSGQYPGQSGPAGWNNLGYQHQWAPPPERKSFLKQHPILAVLTLALAALALMTLMGVFMSAGSVNFGKKVGVIKIEGIIMESKETIDQIHRFRDDGSIAAVVLRVDSPGGTVGASQEIHDEVKKLAEKKPVVVSMGQVAASGGYYVSCPAHSIYANQGTITGSIGVIMEVTNLEGFLDWIKIKNVSIKSGEFKDAGSPYRAMTDKEKAYLQSLVDEMHGQFESAVAEGRDMAIKDVKVLATGKIYTGQTAKEIGLVDEIGNLWDAINKAGELGGIEGEPAVVWPPKKPSSLLEGLMQGLFPGLDTVRRDVESPLRVMYIINVN